MPVKEIAQSKLVHCLKIFFQCLFRIDQCMKCFGAAVKLGKGKGRKGKQMNPEMLSAMTSCSEQHLGTKYQQCTAMMKDNSADKKETHTCYLRVIVR